jgi:hypothetical protein
MRLLGLVAAAVVFLAPLAVLAQHSAATATHASPSASHTAPAPSAGVHSSSTSSPRSTGATSRTGAQEFHTVAKAHNALKIGRANDKSLAASDENLQPEKHGFFSFIHRNKREKCRQGSCAPTPSMNLISQRQVVTPVASNVRFGCTVLPVPNSGIPCNAFSPCCP